MLHLPRVALGAVQPATDRQAICWAMLEALVQSGCQVQHFLAHACFTPRNAALAITGVASRHLDTWLMPKAVCREIFVHGCAGRDLAVVEGEFTASDADDPPAGSRLDMLCDWLDLPRLVVLDASKLHDCQWPDRPNQIDGVLLDRVGNAAEAFQLQTALEALWDVPVLGMLEELPRLRAGLAQLPCGAAPSREMCAELGEAFLRFSRPDRIRELAGRRDLPPIAPAVFPIPEQEPSQPSLTVAVAYDAAFNCYFPDALDLLELHGAKIVDFSPLRDEVLPDADVVYLGCGHPDRYAEALSGNHCMLLALRNHIRGGRRVYAEGGGLAYLCQKLQTPRGEWVPMVGALPAYARANPQGAPPVPVELTFAQGNWLGSAGSRVRGYLNTHWLLDPSGPLTGLLGEPGHEFDLVGQYQVIGSRLHLNFAAQADFLQAFFQPHCPTLAYSGAS
ncbi:MAG TPA: hypothetical protein VFW87_07095 [Pirellulales bacterium]|nr:hypothetical protein [Pirellulales bacterium]